MSDVRIDNGLVPLAMEVDSQALWSPDMMDQDLYGLWIVDGHGLDGTYNLQPSYRGASSLTESKESFWALDQTFESQVQLCQQPAITSNRVIETRNQWDLPDGIVHDGSQWEASGSSFTSPAFSCESGTVQEETVQEISATPRLDSSKGRFQEETRKFSEASSDDSPKNARSKRKASKPALEQPEKKRRPREVERKYRHKLRDHLSELKRTVPTLRAAAEGDDAGVKIEGLPAASNSRKPTVLAKTLEYIRYLEKINRELLVQMEQCGCGKKSCAVM